MEKELIEYLKSVPFGEHQITIKTYRGEITVVDAHTIESVKYTGEPDNVKCFAQILQLLKQYEQDFFTGDMTFTVSYRDGRASTVLKAGFSRLTKHTKQG